jgi:hypothetical protein
VGAILTWVGKSMACPMATRLTPALGRRGFRLKRAVEAAGGIDTLRALTAIIKRDVRL